MTLYGGNYYIDRYKINDNNSSRKEGITIVRFFLCEVVAYYF